MTHIGRRSIPGTSREQVQRMTSDAVLTQGSALHGRSTTLWLRGSPSRTVCKNCQQREHARLECTFGHQENFSKISKSVIMESYHLFFPFMLTHSANIMYYLFQTYINCILFSFNIQLGVHRYCYVFLKEWC